MFSFLFFRLSCGLALRNEKLCAPNSDWFYFFAVWLIFWRWETLRIKLFFRICMLSGYPRARLCGRFSCDEFFYQLTFYVGGEKFLFRWSVVVGGHCANWRKCGSFAGGSYLLALGSAQKKARNAAPSFRRVIRLFMGSFKHPFISPFCNLLLPYLILKTKRGAETLLLQLLVLSA